MKQLSPMDWLVIIGFTLTTLIGLTAHAYSTFQTKEESAKIDKQIERIENKLDQLILWQRK